MEVDFMTTGTMLTSRHRKGSRAMPHRNLMVPLEAMLDGWWMTLDGMTSSDGVAEDEDRDCRGAMVMVSGGSEGISGCLDLDG